MGETKRVAKIHTAISKRTRNQTQEVLVSNVIVKFFLKEINVLIMLIPYTFG